MTEKVKIVKRDFESGEKPYRIQKPAKYGGYGEGVHMSIKGVYNYLITYFREQEGIRVSNSELLVRIGSDGCGIESDEKTIDGLSIFIEDIEARKKMRERDITQRF